MGSFPHLIGFLSIHSVEVTLQYFLALKLLKNNPTRLGKIDSEQQTCYKMKLGNLTATMPPSRSPAPPVMAPDAPTAACAMKSPLSLSFFLPYVFSALVLVTNPHIPPGHTPPYRCKLLSLVRLLLLWSLHLHSPRDPPAPKLPTSCYLAQGCCSQTSVDII